MIHEHVDQSSCPELWFTANRICSIVYTPVHVDFMEMHKNLALERMPWLSSIRNESQARYRIGIHIEVPGVDYEKLSGERVGEPSECIRAGGA